MDFLIVEILMEDHKHWFFKWVMVHNGQVFVRDFDGRNHVYSCWWLIVEMSMKIFSNSTFQNFMIIRILMQGKKPIHLQTNSALRVKIIWRRPTLEISTSIFAEKWWLFGIVSMSISQNHVIEQTLSRNKLHV